MTGTARAVVELEVPFHDVDSLEVVWHGHYLKYLEIARTKLLRDLGFEPRPGTGTPGKDSQQHSLLVVESQCRHSRPLRYGDRVRVTAWIKDADPQIRVAYEVWNLTRNERSARARTTLVVVDAAGKLVPKLSDAALEKLRA